MKDFIWFTKHSFSYMKGYSLFSILKGFPSAWKRFNKLKQE